MADISKIKALDGITYNIKANNIHDDLDSTSASDALSANQGRILNEKCNALNNSLTNITPTITGYTASDASTNNITYPTGKTKSDLYPISVGFYRNARWVFNNSAYMISLTNANIVLEINPGFEYLWGLPYVIMYR